MQLIKDRQLVKDHWQWVELNDPLPPGDVIVPLARWKHEREALLSRENRIGVRINGDDDLTEVVADLAHFALIALEFPVYRDGRCFSHARLLRERYGYQGELRAVGDVLRDQLYYMERCGINAFVLRKGQDPQQALGAFNEFSVIYQSAADGVEPLYRRR